jgi:hypothetical protein
MDADNTVAAEERPTKAIDASYCCYSVLAGGTGWTWLICSALESEKFV